MKTHISEAVQTFKKRFLFLMTEVQVLFLSESTKPFVLISNYIFTKTC